MVTSLDFVFVAFAGLAAGLINAVAGGGTLVTFPLLTAIGLPAVTANVTSTVALWPGFLGSTFAQRTDLAGQEGRLKVVLPIGAAGGIVGGLLLLAGGEGVFRALIPYLLLTASLLLAAQDRLRTWLATRTWHSAGGRASEIKAAIFIGIGAVYGGYFGAGLSVIMLAVLGLLLDESLTRVNALKSALGLVINIAAALFFVFSGSVMWPVVIVMALGALAGGVVGGRIAASIRPATLRWTVVTIGLIVSVVYFVK